MPVVRSRGRGHGRKVVVFLLVVLPVSAAVIAMGSVRLPRVSDVWPLDLDRPIGWIVDRQLADLRNDPRLCRRLLGGPRIAAEPISDRSEGRECGWTNAVRLASAGGARIGLPAATCELAAALALWLHHVVQARAQEHFGERVAGIEHLGAFACRNMRGSPAFVGRLSEHAAANALDIKGFVLADGRRIRVKQHWGLASAEARFLADVHREACRYFRVAIGPAYNAAHHDHFHLDRGLYRACR
jgi:hypothetical protein